MTFFLTWGICMAVNPANIFDQSSFGALAVDTLSVVGGMMWPLHVAFAVAMFVLGFSIRFLGKRWRTFIAFGASAVIGAVPLVYGLLNSDSDAGIMVLLFFGLGYIPFVAAATTAAGCVYGFILPSRRRRVAR